MCFLNKICDLGTQRWAIGFVRGGMQAVMETDHMNIDWVKMPKDRWFADPFILDVADDEILLLVEDFGYDLRKGVISLLHINYATMEIKSRKVLLEIPTHLSFPAIWRKDGHLYVYPESAKSGRLDMYEYDAEKEELTFVKTICDDVVWDSYIIEALGEPLMFTAAKNDYQLDIYKWNDKKERFVSYQQIASEHPNSRLGGAVFEYRGQYYYPAQENSKTYGGAIDIKRIVDSGSIDDRLKMIDEPNHLDAAHLDASRLEQRFSVETVKHIKSPNKKYPYGLHTLNEYKGVVVIDVKGYRYGKVGEFFAKLVALKKRLKK